MARILVVDDDMAAGQLLRRLLVREGHEVESSNSPTDALGLVDKTAFDLVITDFYMPEMNGTELLLEVKKRRPGTDVIMMTAFASIDNAVDAIRKGAYDYIVKPFQNDDLLSAVGRVMEKRRLSEENRFLKEALSKKYEFHNIIGRSPGMQRLFAAIGKVADSDATALLVGESGTGKELVARAIHFAGKRKDSRFVAVNCSALPDTLLESELFGHVRGAFSGATEAKEGLFSYAHGGTLFLDEIADTSPSVQAKLLRAIQDKMIRRLGDNKETATDVRIIAATSKNLTKLIGEERFREDLYYRINVVPITIPPLRERREDIPLLAERFLGGRKKLQPATIDALMRHDWPGNVRELENLIERLVVFTSADMIMPDDLPFRPDDNIYGKSVENLSYNDARIKLLEEFNKTIICNALRQTDGNVSRAAERLRLDRANLQRLMRRYAILSTDFRK